MEKKGGSKEVVHEAPVGRAESDYTAQADPASFALAGQIEQSWLGPKRTESAFRWAEEHRPL
ncbi:hypothetical protein WJM95_33915 [Streptomyces sp. f51]|uniref:hypothetical protein n=1 Tax=Streptomyces sp. f51 TaxID=1827742 RepID=UPI0030CE40BB